MSVAPAAAVPDWLTPGSEVVTFTATYRTGDCDLVTGQVVARVTKTLVILDNGKRWPLKTLDAAAGTLTLPSLSEWDTRTPTMVAPGHPRVALARAAAALRRARNRVDVAHGAWKENPSIEASEVVSQALAVWRELAEAAAGS